MTFLPHGELHRLITTYGYAMVGGMVGLECLGLPLPGEATLITAAVIAGTSQSLDLYLVIAVAVAAASIGTSIGYWLGRDVGYSLILRYGRYIGLTERRIRLGQYLFLRHGGKVVFFGRFIPVLRALAGLLAGVNRMEWRRFLIANATSALVWASIYGFGGYLFGHEIHHLARPVAIAAITVVLLGGLIGIVVIRRHESQLEDAAERALPGPLQPLHQHRHGRRIC